MKTMTLFAAAAALFAATSAAAQAPAQSRAVVIPTAGLDLATASGRAMLDARIRAAADAACAASPADLAGQTRSSACRATLVAAARAQRDMMLAVRGGGAVLAARR